MRALQSGHVPVDTYICPDVGPETFDLPHRTMSREAIDKASYRRASTGIISLFPYFETSLGGLHSLEDRPGDPLLLIVEGMEKPGNLGALLRIADGAGVDGVILVEPAADLFNPNTVRSSTGCLFTVPIATADFTSAAGWLSDHDIRSVAASPEASSTYWEADLSGPCAVWVGAEATGLSGDAIDNARETVSVPMRGAADSLNTSVAAALIVYEAVRQRCQGAV